MSNLRWHAISDEHADYLLGVLPPIYLHGELNAFAVNEPVDYDPVEGADTYTCVLRYGGQSYARECTLRQAQAACASIHAHGFAALCAPAGEGVSR